MKHKQPQKSLIRLANKSLTASASNSIVPEQTANELTRSIIHFITLSGGFATRVQSQGQFRQGIGWTRGTTRRGTADIHAVYRGLHLSIEVKVGRDRQSLWQKQVQQEIERAGGLYFIARNFEDFQYWFTTQVMTSSPKK